MELGKIRYALEHQNIFIAIEQGYQLPKVLGRQFEKICRMVSSLIRSPPSRITRSIVEELKSRSDGKGRASGTSEESNGETTYC